MAWKISIVEVGVIPQLPRTLYVPGANPDDLLDIPCLAYVLDDGTHLVVVDSGPDADTATAHGFRIQGRTAGALARGLSGHGAEPGDVELVVHTHLHYDHCQNDPLFPRARFGVQRTELAHIRRPLPFYEGIAEMCANLEARVVAIDGDTELLPGLRTVANGGHTPGHQSVLVETDDGTACLCGDIVSLEANLWSIGEICPDVHATRTFLERAFAAQWEMIPSHEPALRAHRWFATA